MKFKQKKGFLARDWLVGIILFGGIISFAVLMVVALGQQYDKQVIDPSFSAKYDKLSNTTAIVDKSFQQLNTGEGMKLIGALTTMFQAVPSMISLMFTSIFIIPSMLISAGTDFGIPSSVIAIGLTVMVAVITVILVYVAISFVNRSRL